MTIDGSPARAAETFNVVNPATGEVFDRAPTCRRDQVDLAMSAAQRAFTGWRRDDDARRASLAQAAQDIADSVDDLAPVLTSEQGKPLAEAKLEIRSVAAWCRYFAKLEVAPEIIQDDERARIAVQRRPMGVVAAITPWNFPLLLAAWKIAPALRAGNTMVLKPSPYTPLSTLKLVEIMNRSLPPGVLNAVSGGDELGAWLTNHPTPRKISFTGSVATGRRVARAAAEDLKRVTLELGGNDPAILLDDVDPAAIAERLFWAAFSNSGQVCSAIKRVYVPESLYSDIVDALAEQAKSVRIGNGLDAGVQLGPLNNQPQRTRVAELVADAVASGATAITGGHALDRPGYFYAPTILVGATDGMRVVDEEQFGPALPIIAYRDIGDALERANGTHFGLSASVWSADPERAEKVGDELECGTAWINTHLALRPDQPFGGAKWSGIGVENGPWGLHSFTEVKVVHRSRR